jgi:hypothetical protein
MNVDSISISFIVHPVSFIDVSIHMNEFPVSMSSVVFPLTYETHLNLHLSITFISGSIRPHLGSITISESSNPLPCISSPCLECIGSSVFSLSLRIVFHVFRNSLLRFIHCKILAISLSKHTLDFIQNIAYSLGLLNESYKLSRLIASP